MKRIIVLLVFSIYYVNGMAQDTINRYNLDRYADLNITMSPSALVNTFTGVQLGIEKKIYNRLFLELESAYLFKTVRNFSATSEGYRLKFGAKIPMNSDGFFLLANVFYRKTFHNRISNFERFDGLFFQDIEYQQTKTLLGPAMGFTYFLEGKKLSYEIGNSYGIGIYKVTSDDLPMDAEIRNRSIFSFYNNDGVYRYLIISLQIKIKLKVN